jgi:hypothetical protein
MKRRELIARHRSLALFMDAKPGTQARASESASMKARAKCTGWRR